MIDLAPIELAPLALAGLFLVAPVVAFDAVTRLYGRLRRY